ncbi:unnamed protein product, partial [Wuchereria bancrofti]
MRSESHLKCCWVFANESQRKRFVLHTDEHRGKPNNIQHFHRIEIQSNETDELTEEKEYHQVAINDNSSNSGDDREGWDNKMQFLMGVISYAVGLGNVWRFPYLCQKNGGGAFLIPYCIMMFVEGTPLFLVELGIGQKLRLGPVGVWNEIHPSFGGVGVSAAIVSFLVALYYNVIIT